MATLAIRGHATRGKEVIKILEMLGGKNTTNLHGECDNMIYIINSSYYGEIIYMLYRTDGYVVFTLEEFLEKYPYKVGDKIVVKGLSEYPKSIHFMKWFDDNIHYSFDNETWFLPSALNPYKEETMENKSNLLQQLKDYFDNTPREVIEKEWHEYDKYNKIGPDVIKYLEYVNNIRNPKFPKTYEECLKILEYNVGHEIPMNHGHKGLLIMKLQRLLIFRDAYWKLVGDWKPDWENNTNKYVIANYKNHIVVDVRWHSSMKLSFPTAEMRDAFYENFKELIEQCKELL